MEEIKDFFKKQNFDIRVVGNSPRWIDQKCTPDVLWSISDYILNYVEEHPNEGFTISDIWKSDYAKNLVKEEFSKPNTDSEKAKNEYDKFFSQPMNLLCFAGILKDISSTSKHLYKVNNLELLQYIAKNDNCAYRFLYIYIEEVLKQSGLMPYFDDFFEYQNQMFYEKVKTSFENFCFKYTKINNKTECDRIFTKIINPLACSRVKKGTKKGRISSNIIPKQELMYNRDNFRDIFGSKPKNISRKEWIEINPDININRGHLEHQLFAAKRMLKEYNDKYFNKQSELTRFISNQTDETEATQIHHIFPKSEYPTIMAYLENLIAITPNQHFQYAHLNNNTRGINLEAQKDCLMAKTQSIKHNLLSNGQEPIYSFSNFLEVLAVGWNNDDVLEIPENDYCEIIREINSHYVNLI